MKYSILNYNETWMPVYYNISEGNPGNNVCAIVFRSESAEADVIAELFFTSTNFDYIIHINKMNCELKTANKIIEFFNDSKNWKP